MANYNVHPYQRAHEAREYINYILFAPIFLPQNLGPKYGEL